MCIMVRLVPAGHSEPVAVMRWLTLPWQAFTELTCCSATFLPRLQLVCGVGMPPAGHLLHCILSAWLLCRCHCLECLAPNNSLQVALH